MKKKFRSSIVLAGIMGVVVCSSAMAATVPFKSDKHIFSMDDLLGTFTGTTYAENPALVCTSPPCDGMQPQIDPNTGAMTYPIDSEFAFEVTDFVGAERKIVDGVFEEGWIGNLFDEYGLVSGVVISSPETKSFKTGGRKGSWCAGMGGNSVKCSAELYTVMEHVLTCTEKVPYFYTGTGWEACVPLDDSLYTPDDPLTVGNPFSMEPNESDLINIMTGGDYSMTMKDDGKFLYRWGSMHKRPTDVRMYAKLVLPDEWKVAGADYTITRAELIVNHKITNNPNDQIRPEDFENEGAKGRIPGFDDIGGVLTSDVDCYEGDGHSIPAGTLFKDPLYAQGEPVDADGDGILDRDSGGWSTDLMYGYTNAWYTTMDREPFEKDEFDRWGARYRLKAPKFGQNLPALEIPIIDCTAPPLEKLDIKYTVGADTSTVINLLDWADGPSPLSTSAGWKAYLDGAEESPIDGLSGIEGLPLTDDFDVAVYVKGDYKATAVYSVQLLIEYDDPAVMVQAELCADGIDNDGDGDVDCADADCGGAWCPETNCTDGLDNDEDAYVDCGDPDCAAAVNCLPDGEICDDGIDNDLDGLVDCVDDDCRGDDACVPEVCSDGIDNNSNGLVDCDDAYWCADTPYCNPVEICNDTIDNDGDGLTDCADSDCDGNPACVENICTDGVDNDLDGDIDCADSDCFDNTVCNQPDPEICNDSIDNDGDGDVDCADSECVDAPACLVEICDNGADDDLDGFTDCDDGDCVNDPSCASFTCDDFTEKTPCKDAGCTWSNRFATCS